MPTIDSVTTALSALVPSGKAVLWLLAAGASAFMAGVGVTLSTNELAELPEVVDALAVTQERNVRDIRVLRVRADSASADRKRILCLVTLTATGEAVSPLEVNARCP